jgi:hypothetical protein
VTVSSSSSILKSLLKYGTAVLLLITAIGYPAVYFQYDRFHLPTSFISYDQAFRAGLLPSAVLIWFVICVVLAGWS